MVFSCGGVYRNTLIWSRVVAVIIAILVRLIVDIGEFIDRRCSRSNATPWSIRKPPRLAPASPNQGCTDRMSTELLLHFLETLIKYFVIASEVKQSSTVVLKELLDCRVAPLLAMTQLIRACMIQYFVIASEVKQSSI